jgi:hypothetical protein
LIALDRRRSPAAARIRREAAAAKASFLLSMLDSSSLATALARRAAADPESPFLFWSHGWHWQWWSWRRTADLAARWAGELGGGLAAGARAGFAGDVFPQAIALDLAVQAAGLTPAPLAAVPWPGGEAVAAALRELECAAWLEAGTEGEVRVTSMGPVPERTSSPPGLLARDAEGVWRTVGAARAVEAARRVEEAIGGVGPGRRGGREIVVLGRSLGDAPGRLVAAWAVVAGAAVVLEADAERRLAAALWARPTVFCGSRSEILALGGRLGVTAGSRPPARGRLPLGRLRSVLQEEQPEPEEVEIWHRYGVGLRQLPDLDLSAGGAGGAGAPGPFGGRGI